MTTSIEAILRQIERGTASFTISERLADLGPLRGAVRPVEPFPRDIRATVADDRHRALRDRLSS